MLKYFSNASELLKRINPSQQSLNIDDFLSLLFGL